MSEFVFLLLLLQSSNSWAGFQCVYVMDKLVRVNEQAHTHARIVYTFLYATHYSELLFIIIIIIIPCAVVSFIQTLCSAFPFLSVSMKPICCLTKMNVDQNVNYYV